MLETAHTRQHFFTFTYLKTFSCNVSRLVFTLFHQTSDVEGWLNNCVTKSDDRKANVPKQALWDSFCTFMNIDMQVGKGRAVS